MDTSDNRFKFRCLLYIKFNTLLYTHVLMKHFTNTSEWIRFIINKEDFCQTKNGVKRQRIFI